MLILSAGMAMIVPTITMQLARSGADSGTMLYQGLAYKLLDITFLVLGALLVARRPENRVSWLFAFIGLNFAVLELCDEYATFMGAERPNPPLAAVLAAWVASWAWPPAFGSLATLLLLWFPTGRLPSPRWKPVQTFAIVLMAVLPPLLAVGQDDTSNFPNPFATEFGTRAVQIALRFIGPLFPLVVALCASSLVVRFRRARGDERQQLKWVIFGATTMTLYMAIDTLMSRALGIPTDTWFWRVFGMAAFLSVPLGVAIAILRYRLYDIDVIINRTLVYALLSAVLAVIYLGSILLLQRILPLAPQSDVAVAASTLAVAAVFRPIRDRIQSFIDRRFYRTRYDAQRTLQAFATAVRSQVDLDSMRRELTQTVEETMQPSSASLWLREGRR